MIKYFLILFCLVSIHIPYSFAQDKVNIDDIVDIDDFEQIKFDRLKRIRKEIVQLENQIFLTKKKSLIEDDMVNKLKFESEIERLKTEYNDKRVLFIETMTGLSILSRKTEAESKKNSFTEDLSAILEPALSGIKSLSVRPREIQSLEGKIKLLRGEIENLNLAQRQLDGFIANKKYKDFVKVIKKSKKKIDLLQTEYKIQLEDAQFKLIKLEQNSGSFVGAFSQVIFDFLKTKGKNLFLAISAFLLIIWLIGSIKNKVISFFVEKLIRVYGPGEHGPWYVRPLKVIYSLIGFLLALFVAIVILYIMNDWVLVTLILIVIGALIWSSKHYFPLFLEQSKIVLNLGAIRENEVVTFRGIAWKIKTLGYYCRLENPLLTGGSLRISSKELLSYHSRPIQANEPWFPTQTNDWVMLADKSFGKVVFQSPEQVVIKAIGGAHKHLRIEKFLEENPINFSHGFAVEQIVGVDYGHQKIVLDEIIPLVKDSVGVELKELLKDDYQYVKELNIEFKAAAASSLDIRCYVICSGEIAAKAKMMERRVQVAFVRLCNERGYSIPFNQLTVHMAKHE